ncbi:MAG: hypothetical protein KAR05_10290 [Candidatus Omnitrophica bacterium]|nr:hypothetical protein [Candidatus Omnitrophota bacterium]
MKTLKIPFLCLLCLLFFLPGCYSPRLPHTSLSDAHNKFKKICREDYGLNIVTKQVDNTFWIYWPMENEIYDTRVKPVPAPVTDGRGTSARSLNHIDAQFKGAFHIQYDVMPTRKYVKDAGYSWTYTEAVQQGFTNIRNAIARSFSQVEDNPQTGQIVFSVGGDVDYTDSVKHFSHKRLVHSYVKTDEAPEFFVIIISNINKGVEISNLSYLKDFLRGMSDYYFSAEYNLRTISEELKGDPDIVGDKTGEHIDFHAVTWPEFLTKQIIHRIKFKYRQSDFPPEGTDEEEILTIVNQALSGYKFTGFDGVVLEDLGTGSKESYSKEEIKTLEHQNTGR